MGFTMGIFIRREFEHTCECACPTFNDTRDTLPIMIISGEYPGDINK